MVKFLQANSGYRPVYRHRGRPGMPKLPKLSIAAKLYSIFALLAVVTAVTAVVSNHNTRQQATLAEEVDVAARAAQNIERVNSLIYAVVMESRGVYMSDDLPNVKKYGAGLLKFNDQIADVVKEWQKIVRADDAEQFAAFEKRVQQFREFRKELVRRAIEIEPKADRKSTRLNSSHEWISYAVFCLKK